MSISRFHIPPYDDALQDLRDRLSRTRFSGALVDNGWRDGIDLAYLQGLIEYWRDGFQWPTWQKRLENFDHFTTEIDDLALHFIHIRSKNPDALSILLLHGWPGSFLEFLEVAQRLAAPEKYGEAIELGFNLVIPSLPGFGFSQQPRVQGWGPSRIAKALAALMDRLGIRRYGIHGGDFGAIVGGRLAIIDAQHVAGYHTNLTLEGPESEAHSALSSLSDKEQADILAMRQFWMSEAGYAAIQSTKPNTIGVGLDDSPAALCAWIAEKFYAWTDKSVSGRMPVSQDFLLANITLYWLTCTGTSSARLYRERRLANDPPFPSAAHPVTVPTAIARFPFEIVRPPRSWVERHYHIQRWTEFPRGGHFAALEEPVLMANDIRSFFLSLADGANHLSNV